MWICWQRKVVIFSSVAQEMHAFSYKSSNIIKILYQNFYGTETTAKETFVFELSFMKRNKNRKPLGGT
jgi:hypothetical protein